MGEDTLVRSCRLLGETHPLTLGCAANLVIDLREDGADEEAERLAAETEAAYEQTIGSAHPEAQTPRPVAARLRLRPAADLISAVVKPPASQVRCGLPVRGGLARRRHRLFLPRVQRARHPLDEVQSRRRERAAG